MSIGQELVLHKKSFHELTVGELYELLRVRSEVFVVEQNCVYQDIDICNALGMGISPQVVMKWTGHSDYKAMKPYIDAADEIKAEAMKKFDNF